MEHSIRAAELADCDALGAVHVRAWQAAYRGVMPDEYLDGLEAQDRAAMWRRAFPNPRPDRHVDVIVVADDVVGFAASGPEAGEAARSGVGELYAINLDPSSWGHGLGRALLRSVTKGLADDGYLSAVLWVAPQNRRARNLYESEAWVDDGSSREEPVLGVTVSEVRYRKDFGI